MNLSCLLISDGSSDRALIPIIEWVLRVNGVNREPFLRWADLGRLRRPPHSLTERIQRALVLYRPCELLFVHRDTEGQNMQSRIDEIDTALGRFQSSNQLPPVIPVVPVRMLEAWLLVEETALRKAAGNPRGIMELDLPDLDRLESLPDPKEAVDRILKVASGLGRIRQKSLHLPSLRLRIADHMNDFPRLRSLPAFCAFEQKAREVLRSHGWMGLVD